jgi:hypothetical protein
VIRSVPQVETVRPGAGAAAAEPVPVTISPPISALDDEAIREAVSLLLTYSSCTPAMVRIANDGFYQAGTLVLAIDW